VKRNIIVVGDRVGDNLESVDLLICALGYESRSSYLARIYEKRVGTGIAVAFSGGEEPSYCSNRKFYQDSGFAILPYREKTYNSEIAEFLEGLCTRMPKRTLRVLVDISSMSRPMIARTLLCLSYFRVPISLEVEFAYCPAKFVPPNSNNAPVTLTEPVVPELAGWTNRPDLPVSAVVGLGYEYEQALGTLEYLETGLAWAFIPFGEDRQYDDAVEENNKDFREFLTSANIHSYRVDRPFDCFLAIESLTYGLLRETRPILVPFGPKLFALLSMLVSLLYAPNVTVWRVSGDQSGEATDRHANGKLIFLQTRFSLPDHLSE
jgi:hypothetical protein